MKEINFNSDFNITTIMNYVSNNPNEYLDGTHFNFANTIAVVSRDYSDETTSVWNMVDRGSEIAKSCANGWEKIYSFGSWYCRNKQLNIRIWITSDVRENKSDYLI